VSLLVSGNSLVLTIPVLWLVGAVILFIILDAYVFKKGKK